MTEGGVGRGPAGLEIGRGPAALIALAFGGLLATAAFVLFEGRGLFGDEGSFCTAAQWVVDGALPYRDFFNEKPPLQYFWTAAIMALSEPTLTGARIASGVVLALTAGCIVLGPLSRRRNGLVVAGLMLVTALVAIRLEAYRNTTDSTLALLYALGVALALRSPRRAWETVLLGGVFGLALGFRQAALAPAIVLLVSPWLAGGRLAFIAGVLAGLALWVGPLAAAGIVPGLVQATVLFHVGNAGASGYLGGSIDHPAGVVAWTLLAAVAVAGGGRTLGERLAILGLLITMALAFFGQKNEFRLWPSAAAALAIIAWSSRSEAWPAWARAAVLGAPLALATLLASAALRHLPPRHLSIETVALEVRQMSAPGETVWVGPFDPFIYCMAQRRPASRYYFLLPWTAKPEVRREVLRDIEAKRPIIVIQPLSWLRIDDVLPGLAPVLKADYRVAPATPATRREGIIVYRPIRPVAAAPPPAR